MLLTIDKMAGTKQTRFGWVKEKARCLNTEP